jgi:hypothetical protein
MKIQIQKGTYSGAELEEDHLVRHHLKNVNSSVDAIIHYAERRYLMTFFVTGVTDSRYTSRGQINVKGQPAETASTFNAVKNIPEGELIDGNMWKYKVQGRIQRASEVIAQIGTATVGTTQKGSVFFLTLRDDYLKLNTVARFPNGEQARVVSQPTGGQGSWTYQFEAFAGRTFDWNSWIGFISGTKTIFGGYSSFSEGSLRGYGNIHYGDMYANHVTTQRKGLSITGDANVSKIYWYEANGEKGYVFEAERQARAQFLLEDDYQKMWGQSTMKDLYGNLLTVPSQTDPQTGKHIVAGDGWVEQVKGANDATSSGQGGNPTYEDFEDMVSNIKANFDDTSAHTIYVRTGSKGKTAAHNVITQYGRNMYNITHNIDTNNIQGGASPSIGFDFSVLDVSGNRLIFVEDPQMSDKEKFPARLRNGNLVEEMTYYFIDATPDDEGQRNIEIRAKGSRGINRNMVYGYFNGMTGDGVATSPVDAKEVEMLKQNMLVVYRTNTSGILVPPATA